MSGSAVGDYFIFTMCSSSVHLLTHSPIYYYVEGVLRYECITCHAVASVPQPVSRLGICSSK